MSHASSNSLINTTNLSVAIEGNILCSSLTVSMHAGQTWALLGSNGSGKTSLILTLAGLIPAHSGEILLDEKNLTSYNPKELAQLRSVLFQHSEDTFPASVLETVLSGRHPHIPGWQTESPEDYRIAEHSLNLVDLTGFENRDVNSLSGGERQRVSIATCLAQNSIIRLFDEPTNHLDMKHQDSILHLISQNSQQLNLIILQDINQATRHCTHGLFLYHDGSVETGTIKDMLTVKKLENLYDCQLRVLKDGEKQVFVYA